MTVPKTVHPAKPKTLPKSLGFSKYCLLLDGSEDYVDVGDYAVYEGYQHFTVGMWFKTDDVVDNTCLMAKNNVFWVRTNPDGIHFTLYDGGVYPNTPDWDVSGRYNVWNFLVCQYDAPYARVYGNGVLEAERDIGTFSDTSTDPLQLGDRNNSEWFPGHLSDMFFYSRALSLDEIRGIMLDYHNLPQNGLEGWWRFEEGTGLTAYDKSGNGNDGDLLPSDSPPTWEEVRKWELRAGAGL